MTRKNLSTALNNLALLLVVPAGMCMTSCSEDVMTSAEEAEVEKEITEFNFTFNGKSAADITRAISAPVTGVYIYGYQGTTRKADNIYFTQENGKWTTTGKVAWPTKGKLINFYGLSDSFFSLPLDNMKKRLINFQMASDNMHDVWYGSTLNTNEAKSGGGVNMNFTRLISSIHFSCKNSMEDGQVHINKIEVHNLVDKGAFTYGDKVDGTGTWKEMDSYANYERSFPVQVVDPLVKKQQVTDNAAPFYLIPQSTTSRKWKTKASAPVSLADADADHQVYLAVYCRVFQKDSEGNWTKCVWGSSGEYLPIYISLSKNWSNSNAATTIIFDIGKGFKADGTEWTPEPGNIITFSQSMLLEPEEDEEGYVDRWEENVPIDVTL